MSDAPETPAQPPAPPEPAASEDVSRNDRQKKALRRRTIQFVVVFMASVFVLLFGYELARSTVANDWYLLRVAHSTTFLLKHVGYSCELGNGGRMRGREAAIRAALATWKRGEPIPTPLPGDSAQSGSAPEPPLTPWEAWEYQAAVSRRNIAELAQEVQAARSDTTLAEPERTQRIQAAEAKYNSVKQRDIGPLVSFVWKQGPQHRLNDVKAKLQEVSRDTSLPQEEQAAEIEKIRAEMAQLQDVVNAAVTSGNAEGVRDISFSFVVVPDCGAVQAMAIFVAAILAFPALWRTRLLGIVIGLPILYWVNALRLAVLGVIGAIDNGGTWFKFAHEYVWQGIYIVFVVALWMAWVEFFVRRRSS